MEASLGGSVMPEQSKKMPHQDKATAGPSIVAADLPDFEEKVEAFKEYYSINYPRLRAAEKTRRNLLQLLTTDIGIADPKIDSRIKERNECIKKFGLKYRDRLERAGQDYNIQDHITDLIGLRIICLYETDIPLVETVIKENLNVIEATNKTKSLIEQVDSFGYKGLHLDVRLNTERCQFPEYKSFGSLRFEIQLRSIVQDAWSEVDHKLKYKRQIPNELKRRIVRLAALFELADQEFVAIRDETVRMEQSATGASEEEAQESSADELNSFSFLTVMKSRHGNYTFDPIKIQGFLDEVKEMDPGLRISEVRAAIDRYSDAVKKYQTNIQRRNFKLNPFTEMRHILYLVKPTTFDRMLWPRQRDGFLEWLKREEPEIEVEAAE
jgi:putative GTP pyrophosphokinase